jgi:hypothetical protein
MTTATRTEPLAHETDGFVHVVLGLLAELRRIDAVLPPATDAPAPSADDDPATLAVLGLVSLRRTLERWVEIAGRDVADPAPPRTPRTAPREIAR